MTRVTEVQHSRTDLVCGRCRKPLPKGSAYRWAKPGFRSTTKLVRCMDPACAFRPSELTTSLLSDVYAAQEGLQDYIDTWDGEDPDDLVEAAQTAADEAEEVRDAYDTANDEWTSNGGADNEDFCERRDAIEEWMGDLTSLDLPERPEPDMDVEGAEEGDDPDAEALAEWVQECRDAVQEVCNGLEV